MDDWYAVFDVDLHGVVQVVNLVRQAALDLARWGVRVNAIAPGPFMTNIGGSGPIDSDAQARWGATVALGRMGDPREIRGLALLLASGASSFMTGRLPGGRWRHSPVCCLITGQNS